MYAVYKHFVYARAKLMGRFEGGCIGNHQRVYHNNIGKITGDYRASLLEP
ncbi:hypothetical protein SDC9_152968 [bioreactor metagenome]|uniref:Uncharacterized protein n=1 Tax=bioreactor metagenome TaxID=1076179 RepID=A0A645EUL5_9ZZZZ